MAADDTRGKQGGFQLWKPGQSGNPTGRPKGARSKLGEEFIQSLYEDYKAHGVSVIERVREARPHEYLRIVASLLPKQLEISDNPFDDVSDDDLSAIIEYARAMAKKLAESGGGDAQPEGPVH